MTAHLHSPKRRRTSGARRLWLGLVGALALGLMSAAPVTAQTAPTMKDAENAGLALLVSGWQNALAQNGTADQQTAFDNATAAPYAQYITDGILGASTDPLYAAPVAIAAQEQNPELDFYGNLLAASVSAQGASAPVSNGVYVLAINPSGLAAPANGLKTFTVYNAASGAYTASASNLSKLANYMTPDDAASLPFTTGALSLTDAFLLNQSAAGLQEALWSGTQAQNVLQSGYNNYANGGIINLFDPLGGASVGAASSSPGLSSLENNEAPAILFSASSFDFPSDTDLLGLKPPKKPTKYYTHTKTNVHVVVTVREFKVSEKTVPLDYWTPGAKPASAVLVQTDQVDEKPKDITEKGVTVSSDVKGTVETWKDN